MKLLEYWENNKGTELENGIKLIVEEGKFFKRKLTYTYFYKYNQWFNVTKGHVVTDYDRVQQLYGMVHSVRVQNATQLHRIAFDKLTEGVEES